MDYTFLRASEHTHLFDLVFHILLNLIADSQSKKHFMWAFHMQLDNPFTVKQRLMTINYCPSLGSDPKASKRLNAWHNPPTELRQKDCGKPFLWLWVPTLQSVCALPDKSSCRWDEMHSVLLDSKLQMPITEIKSLNIFHPNHACKIYQQHYAIGSAFWILAEALDSLLVGIYSCSAHAVTKETWGSFGAVMLP